MAKAQRKQAAQPATAKAATPQILPIDSLTRIRGNKITTVTQYPAAARLVWLNLYNPHKKGRADALVFAHTCKTVADFKAKFPSKIKYLGRWVTQGLLSVEI